ncbi:MAG: transcriptional regulator [Afipia sp. 62-7]|nr:helix-turn-helix transcriptional regulator [Afipia sp.]OJU14855.1 MAG: transcriptional regulator [Afipia sp. 62-7]
MARSATAIKEKKPSRPQTSTATVSTGKKLPRLTERRCSISSTVNILSDAWAFLVIREAFFGAKRFEEFRSGLEISRATLTDRLRRLTREGIFREASYSDTSSRVEYKLTKSGIDLYPAFMSLMQFGDRWLVQPEDVPLQLIHESCNCVSKPIVACSCCQKLVVSRKVTYHDGPGAGRIRVEASRRTRRNSDDFMRGRPSSVSRALEVIGDRWSFLVIREAFYGATRFDQFESELNIASNILTDRLARLVDRGVFERRKYQSSPDRFEYLLTPMGADLHGPLIMMMAWGDRWRSAGEPPMLLKHETCGKIFTPTVVCNRCGEPIHAYTMKYRMRYDPNRFGGPKSGRAVPGRV